MVTALGPPMLLNSGIIIPIMATIMINGMKELSMSVIVEPVSLVSVVVWTG